MLQPYYFQVYPQSGIMEFIIFILKKYCYNQYIQKIIKSIRYINQYNWPLIAQVCVACYIDACVQSITVHV